MHEAQPADRILLNGKIVTVDSEDTVAEAVAIKNGRFIAVGTDEEIETYSNGACQRDDLEGRTVLPGIIDYPSRTGGIAADGDQLPSRSGHFR